LEPGRTATPAGRRCGGAQSGSRDPVKLKSGRDRRCTRHCRGGKSNIVSNHELRLNCNLSGGSWATQRDRFRRKVVPRDPADDTAGRSFWLGASPGYREPFTQRGRGDREDLATCLIWPSIIKQPGKTRWRVNARARQRAGSRESPRSWPGKMDSPA